MWRRVCRRDEVPDNGMKEFAVDGAPRVLIVNAGAEYFAKRPPASAPAGPAEQALLHHGSHHLELAAEAHLEADAGLDLRLAHGVAHGLGVVPGKGDRLLEQDVLAGAGGGDGLLRVFSSAAGSSRRREHTAVTCAPWTCLNVSMWAPAAQPRPTTPTFMSPIEAALLRVIEA